jgi:hypothetical protein
MLTNRLRKSIAWSNSRWLVALIGFILIVAGQYMMAKPNAPSSPATSLGLWLNNSLHFGIASIDYVLEGFSLLFIG